jgi:L-asparagine permease
VANLTAHGGFFPHGVPVVLMSLQSVVFAYAAIELVGIAAGETENPRKVLPRAVNSVIWRIGVFYVGSVLLLAMVLPWTAYSGGESPFVTVFSRLGVPGAGDIMNAVVLTAALSSCNSGLYSTGRVMRALALRGEAPEFVGRMNARHVPYGGILFTSIVLVFGVVLNYVVPKMAFEIATSIASLGVVAVWATLVYCQLRLRAAARRGEVDRPPFRMPGAPVTNWLTLGFLAVVVLLMAFADRATEIAFWCLPAVVAVLLAGWRIVRGRTVPDRTAPDPHLTRRT